MQGSFGVALSGALWPTFSSNGLTELARTGETNDTHSLYFPITSPLGSRKLNARQSVNEVGEVVSTTKQLRLPPGNISGTRFWLGLSGFEGHSAAGKIM